MSCWMRVVVAVTVVMAFEGATHAQPGSGSAQPGSSDTQSPSAEQSRLVVSCGTPGARVFLDGKEVFIGPGRVERHVAAGRHEVTAMLPGRLADRRIFSLRPGSSRIVAVTPLPMDSTVRTHRRWRQSIPWIVVGSGAATVLLGFSLQSSAKSDFDAYGDDIARLCSQSGCTADSLPQSVKDLNTRAERKQVAARVLWGAGSALLVAGVVMVYLNHPAGPTVTASRTVSIVPLADRTGAIVSTRLGF